MIEFSFIGGKIFRYILKKKQMKAQILHEKFSNRKYYHTYMHNVNSEYRLKKFE